MFLKKRKEKKRKEKKRKEKKRKEKKCCFGVFFEFFRRTPSILALKTRTLKQNKNWCFLFWTTEQQNNTWCCSEKKTPKKFLFICFKNGLFQEQEEKRRCSSVQEEELLFSESTPDVFFSEQQNNTWCTTPGVVQKRKHLIEKKSGCFDVLVLNKEQVFVSLRKHQNTRDKSFRTKEKFFYL